MHIEINDNAPRNNEELAKALLAKAILAIANMLQPPGPGDDPNRFAMMVNRVKLAAAIGSIKAALDTVPDSEAVADLVIHEAAMLMEKYMFDDTPPPPPTTIDPWLN